MYEVMAYCGFDLIYISLPFSDITAFLVYV